MRNSVCTYSKPCGYKSFNDKENGHTCSMKTNTCRYNPYKSKNFGHIDLDYDFLKVDSSARKVGGKTSHC